MNGKRGVICLQILHAISWLILSVTPLWAAGPSFDFILVYTLGVVAPEHNVILVKKDNNYCAIQFVKFWSSDDGKDHYAQYDVYSTRLKKGWFNYGSGYKSGTLHNQYPRGIGRLAFSFGNIDVDCGFAKIQWVGSRQSSVTFYSSDQKPGDYGVELAPTPWTDIKQVDFKDKRIRWYRYDPDRADIKISIKSMWQ